MSLSPTFGLLSVSTPFGEIAYRQTGAGPAAVFLHGLFLNGDLWRHQLDALSDLRRCIAIDLLANAASPCPPPGEFSITTQADMVLALVDALDIGSFDLVGNDSGGAIAQIVVARVPGRVRTLTLTNCDAHDNWPPAAFAPIHDMANAGTLADGLAALAADPALALASLASGFEHPDDLSDEFVSAMFSPFADPAKAAAVQDYVKHMEPSVTVAIRDQLARLLVPTLVVWGTADEFFDVTWARWLQATIPGAVGLVELDGAKLLFPFERPDQLNRELRQLWTNSELHTALNEYLHAWNDHDLDRVMSRHSPDTVFSLRTGDLRHEGTAAVRARFEHDLAAWPDVHWTPLRRTIAGNVCIVESTMTATAGVPIEALGFRMQAGTPVHGTCVDILTVTDDGMITRKDTYLDVTELLGSRAGVP